MARVRKHRDKWQVLIRDGHGRGSNEIVIGSYIRKTDADNMRKVAEAEALKGLIVDPAAGRQAFATVMRDHLERQPFAYNTRHAANNAIDHAEAYFGTRSIAVLRSSDMQAFVAHLHSTKELSPLTVATIFRYVRATTRAAHLDGVIARDPSARIKLPRADGERMEIPTVDEVRALYAGANDNAFAVAVVLGAGLGLRGQEAAGLTKDRINFLRKTVRVDRQWHGKLDQFERPKSRSSIRDIPADDETLALIAHHIKVHDVGEHDVILHSDGRPLNSNRMSWRWEQTQRATGLDQYTFHDLRHHYASSLINGGCSVVAVKDAMGHSSAAITLNTYAHLWPTDGDRIRSAIGQLWANGADQGRTKPAGHRL